MRRSISRVVLFLGILVGVLALGANSTLTSHRTADAWPNPLVVTTEPSANPLPVNDATGATDATGPTDATGVSDSVVEAL